MRRNETRTRRKQTVSRFSVKYFYRLGEKKITQVTHTRVNRSHSDRRAVRIRTDRAVRRERLPRWRVPSPRSRRSFAPTTVGPRPPVRAPPLGVCARTAAAAVGPGRRWTRRPSAGTGPGQLTGRRRGKHSSQGNGTAAAAIPCPPPSPSPSPCRLVRARSLAQSRPPPPPSGSATIDCRRPSPSLSPVACRRRRRCHRPSARPPARHHVNGYIIATLSCEHLRPPLRARLRRPAGTRRARRRRRVYTRKQSTAKLISAQRPFATIYFSLRRTVCTLSSFRRARLSVR